MSTGGDQAVLEALHTILPVAEMPGLDDDTRAYIREQSRALESHLRSRGFDSVSLRIAIKKDEASVELRGQTVEILADRRYAYPRSLLEQRAPCLLEFLERDYGLQERYPNVLPGLPPNLTGWDRSTQAARLSRARCDLEELDHEVRTALSSPTEASKTD